MLRFIKKFVQSPRYKKSVKNIAAEDEAEFRSLCHTSYTKEKQSIYLTLTRELPEEYLDCHGRHGQGADGAETPPQQ